VKGIAGQRVKFSQLTLRGGEAASEEEKAFENSYLLHFELPPGLNCMTHYAPCIAVQRPLWYFMET